MFSLTVFYDERIVIVAEQRPDASEEDSFQWMSRVLQVNQMCFQFYCANIQLTSDSILLILIEPLTLFN